MKKLMCAAVLGLLLTVGASAAEPPNPFPEPVENLSLEALLAPETPVDLATLYSCDVQCYDGTTASLTAVSQFQCWKQAKLACGSGNCQYWFDENLTGLCYGGL